jgi:hypothetical protein
MKAAEVKTAAENMEEENKKVILVYLLIPQQMHS